MEKVKSAHANFAAHLLLISSLLCCCLFAAQPSTAQVEDEIEGKPPGGSRAIDQTAVGEAVRENLPPGEYTKVYRLVHRNKDGQRIRETLTELSETTEYHTEKKITHAYSNGGPARVTTFSFALKPNGERTPGAREVIDYDSQGNVTRRVETLYKPGGPSGANSEILAVIVRDGKGRIIKTLEQNSNKEFVEVTSKTSDGNEPGSGTASNTGIGEATTELQEYIYEIHTFREDGIRKYAFRIPNYVGSAQHKKLGNQRREQQRAEGQAKTDAEAAPFRAAASAFRLQEQSVYDQRDAVYKAAKALLSPALPTLK